MTTIADLLTYYQRQAEQAQRQDARRRQRAMRLYRVYRIVEADATGPLKYMTVMTPHALIS